MKHFETLTFVAFHICYFIRIEVHDGHSDPLGWDNVKSNENVFTVHTDLTKYLTHRLGL